MIERQMIEKLVDLCLAYHRALDLALTMLAAASPQEKPFLSSRSMWATVIAGHQMIREIKAELAAHDAADLSPGRTLQ